MPLLDSSTSGRLTLYQTLIAIAALIGITVLAFTDKVSGDVVVAIYSAIIGAGLASGGAIANGAVQARVESARAEAADAIERASS